MRHWREFRRPTLPFHFLPILLLLTAIGSSARDLRPSDHGLTYQDPPRPAGQNSPPEMLSFFGPSTSTTPPSNVAFPNATTAAPPSWWLRRGGGDGKDRVRDALLVASLVCGITGIVLLIASALLFVFRFRREQSTSNATPPEDRAAPAPAPAPPPPHGGGRRVK